MDTVKYGWEWIIDEFWCPEGLWMKLCVKCSRGPLTGHPDYEFEACTECA